MIFVACYIWQLRLGLNNVTVITGVSVYYKSSADLNELMMLQHIIGHLLHYFFF